MEKILFVDDEPQILQALRRMLRGKRGQWHMAFAASGPEALELLEKERFDVIVTDMRMPIMDGAALLEEVRQRYPHMVRIILSGHSDQAKILKSVKPAHQYLAKPVDPEQLEQVLTQALSLRKVLNNEQLIRVLSQVESLPALPQLYTRLMEAIESPQSSLEEIGEIISQDLGMTATVLKLVNSAFFGIAHRVTSPAQAVALLGLDVVQALVLSYQLFSTHDFSQIKGFSFESLWRHSLTTGGFAKTIAQIEGLPRNQVDLAFFAGVLHDVGKLPLCSLVSNRYQRVLDRVRSEDRPLWEVEQEELGATHAEVGAYLMGLWGMSEDVIRALAFHHRPSDAPEKGCGVLAVVHAANVLEHELYVINRHYHHPQFDPAFLEAAGLQDRIELWREACRKQLYEGEGDGHSETAGKGVDG
jgi:HD-like signal output (HDOD) protein